MINSEVKKDYEALSGAEGYIELSGEDTLIILQENDALPSWQSLHEKNNFIIEAHFFNPQTKKSYSIRQINSEYKTLEHDLKDDELKKANIFQAKKGKSVKIAQIWELENDELCENFETSKLKKSVFAGFHKGEKS